MLCVSEECLGEADHFLTSPTTKIQCFFFPSAGKYFDEISQDTGKYCFGVEDTFKALEMGAVEILIVWENLDVQRYALKNHSSDGM